MPSSSSVNEFIALKRQTLWSQVRGWAPQTLTLLGASFHTATKATKNQLCHKKYQEIRKGNMYTQTQVCMSASVCVCVQCNGAILFEWLSLCLEFAKSVSEWVCVSLCGCKQKSNNYIEWPMAGKEAAAVVVFVVVTVILAFIALIVVCRQTSEEYIVTPSRSSHPRLLYTRLRSHNINNVLFCLCFGFLIWQWRLSLPCACIIYVKLYLLL